MDRRILHLPLLAVIVAALALGVMAGLGRIGWVVPMVVLERVGLHGPLLLAGVFGTLIALERAVAMRTVMARQWTFADAAPVLGGAGTILLLVNGATVSAIALLTAGAAGLLAVNLEMLRRHGSADVLTVTLGAGFLLLADAAWLWGRPIALLTPWWIAFLVLTITGERLELARLRVHSTTVRRLFLGAAGIYVSALLFMAVDAAAGVRLSGVGMIALSAWLMRFDIAGVTIRGAGLPRFVAACLLAGYAWLAVAGAIALGAEQLWTGFAYDAFLHAVLLGFVFSMIFGHAFIIVPAILGMPIAYHPLAWVPLVLLHVSVAGRIAGDLLVEQDLRLAAGLLSAVSMGLYGAVIVLGLVRGRAEIRAGRRHSMTT